MSALVLALLYFGFMELLWLDAAERVRGAQSFRARIEAQVLAENAAELAAQNMIAAVQTDSEAEDAAGTMTGRYKRFADDTFTLAGSAITRGVRPLAAEVVVYGRISGADVVIERTSHRP